MAAATCTVARVIEEEAQELRALVKKRRLTSLAAKAILDAVEREHAGRFSLAPEGFEGVGPPIDPEAVSWTQSSRCTGAPRVRSPWPSSAQQFS